MELLLTLTFSSPASIGSYEPHIQDKLWYIRPSSIKGVWRWWARTIVSGVLYDLGCLKGSSDREILKRPTPDEARKISEYVGKRLGLGYVIGEESSASCYKLTVDVANRPMSIGNFRQLTRNYSRIKLLSLARDRRARYTFLIGGRLELKVEYRCKHSLNSLTKAGINTLITALTLTGLGKGARKALGSIDILKINNYTGTRDLKLLLNDVYEALESEAEGPCSKPENIPPVPSLSKDKNIAGIWVISGIRDPSYLHNFFIRSTRARALKGSYYARDYLRETFSAWILGLPRERLFRGGDWTGYHLPQSITRRASTIMASYHNNTIIEAGGVKRNYGLFTALLSGDWPKQLEWRGAGRKKISIDKAHLKEAFRTAINEFLRYSEKMGWEVERIWP